ncbi:M48 family metalloprotease [Hymenobacter daeguensis]
MTREAFVARLEQLQPLAMANPRAYRWRVQAWALLGYGFILLLLLGTVGALGVVAVLLTSVAAVVLILKVGLALGVFAWKVIRSLWVRFDPPKGRVLVPAEAAPLFGLLAEQARALAAPPVHRVLLTADFNASIVQLPRLGVLGWPRNYLMVGLPLLQALSPEQAAAVVAHELGHLRGGHGRFGAWVYCVGQSWEQLLAQLERNGRGTWLSKFAYWYVPRFNAWSHPLRRTAEFEADAAAGRVTSPQALAQALCALEVRNQTIDKLHWDALTAGMATQPRPPADAISRLLPLAKSARLDEEAEDRCLQAALAADPDVLDTHPVLRERLTALGQAAVVPAPPATTAAEAWFGPGLPALAVELDAAWAKEREGFWQERHQLLSAQRQRLRTLADRLAAGQALTPDEAWEHADLTEDHASPAEALPLFRALFGDAAHGLKARFAVGRIRLMQDDPAGLALLEEVMDRSPATRTAALALAQAYHQRRGNKAEVRRLQAEVLRYADFDDQARAERSIIRATDRFLPHGLPAAPLAALQTRLAAGPAPVRRAWLLRKHLTLFAEQPLFVLIVELQVPTGRRPPESVGAAQLEQLARELTLPGECVVVSLNANGWFANLIRQLPASLVYTTLPG